MKTTVGELKEILANWPDAFEVRIVVPCRILREFIEVEKPLADAKAACSRKMIVLETEILDLNPR